MSYSEDNIDALFACMAKEGKLEYLMEKHFRAVQSSQSVWPNLLYQFKEQPQDISLLLESITQAVADGKLPDLGMFWEGQTSTHTLNLMEQNWQKTSVWTAMIRTTKGLQTAGSVPEFQVQVIDKLKDLRQWQQIVEQELMGGKSLNPELFKNLVQKESCRFLLAKAERIPVATALIFGHQKQAGIYLVATAREHRQKGYGRALTEAALKQAQVMGCSLVHIQATQAGYKLYKSLGFTDHGAIHVFRLKPKT